MVLKISITYWFPMSVYDIWLKRSASHYEHSSVPFLSSSMCVLAQRSKT